MSNPKYFKYVESVQPNKLMRTVGIRLNTHCTTFRDIEDVVVESLKDFTVIRNDIKVVCHDGNRDWRQHLGIEFDVLNTTEIPQDYTPIETLGPVFTHSYPAL